MSVGRDVLQKQTDWARLVALNVALTAVGCGDPGAAGPLDAGSDASADAGMRDACSEQQGILPLGIFNPCAPSVTTRYRITALRIPALAEALNGAAVGHNVDGVGDDCSVIDYAGGVDNALIELTDALETLGSGSLDLRGALTSAFGCAAGSADCTPLTFIVEIARQTNAALIRFEDGEGPLAYPSVGSLDGAGNLRLQLVGLPLVIPFPVSGGGTVDLEFSLTSLIVTGTLSESGIRNFVIGGALLREELESVFTQVLTALGRDSDLVEVMAILANLYDLKVAGTCSALSVGFQVSVEAL